MALLSAVQVSLLELTEPPEPELLAQGFAGSMSPAPAIPGRWSLQVSELLPVVQNLQEPESAP